MSSWQQLFELDGKVAVVAGGAGLIGAKLSEVLADAGAHVVIVDQNEELARQEAARISQTTKGEVFAECVNIVDQDQVRAAAQNVWRDLGKCDILINAAHYKGGAFFADLDNYPLDAWREVLDVNLTGTFLMCREFGGRMYRGDGGAIVNISSTYGMVSADPRIYGDSGINSPPAYAATKSGLINFTRYLAVHWRPKVRANVLVPGGVESEQDPQFIKNYCARTPLERMAQRDDYQGAILFMCSQASAYMTGSTVTVDGGWTAW